MGNAKTPLTGPRIKEAFVACKGKLQRRRLLKAVVRWRFDFWASDSGCGLDAAAGWRNECEHEVSEGHATCVWFYPFFPYSLVGIYSKKKWRAWSIRNNVNWGCLVCCLY